jgi:multicomponent Na+:H+ antiporter subunit F
MSLWVQYFTAFSLAISFLGFLFRFIKGPTLFSRVVAIDFITSWSLAAVVLSAMAFDSSWSLQIVPALTMLGFISVIGLAQYIERKKL